MDQFQPRIDDDIFALRPDYHAISIVARRLRLAPAQDIDTYVSDTLQEMDDSASWQRHHLDAWAQTYTMFGAKPKRTPCSAEALRRRAQRDGMLPHINSLVNAYNAVSLRYAIPIGAENIDAYAGTPRLVRARGEEPFETVQNGAPFTDTAEPGEVIWRDERGVTCRRWNWRQSSRTQVDDETTNVWILLEALEPMPRPMLAAAASDLTGLIRAMCPNAVIELQLVDRHGSSTWPGRSA